MGVLGFLEGLVYGGRGFGVLISLLWHDSITDFFFFFCNLEFTGNSGRHQLGFSALGVKCDRCC